MPVISSAAGGEQDEAGTIAEASLIAAAEEVGLSVDAVRRSIAVERLGPLPVARPGDRILGPSQVYADGEVDVPADDALARVDSWLVDGHHLRRDVLRSGHGEWSKRSGFVGVTVRTIRNATGEGKLGDFERVDAAARDTGSGSSVRADHDRPNDQSTIRRRRWHRRCRGWDDRCRRGRGCRDAFRAPGDARCDRCRRGRGVDRSEAGSRYRARIRRLLDAVGAGTDPTRLSLDVVRRATGKATAAGSSALRAVGRIAPPPPAPPAARLDPPRLRPPIRRRRADD